MKVFLIVSVSENTNSFGLYGVVMTANDGQCYEVGVGFLYKPIPGKTWIANMSDAGKLKSIQGITYEIPRELSPMPARLVKELWNKDFSIQG